MANKELLSKELKNRVTKVPLLPKGTILRVENLTINFKTPSGLVQAVRDVSFDLHRGETLCIVGESGSGKSVTSRAIMGILATNGIIEAGHIYFKGQELLESKRTVCYGAEGCT